MNHFSYTQTAAAMIPAEVDHIVVPAIIVSVSIFVAIVTTLFLILAFVIIARKRSGEYFHSIVCIFIILTLFHIIHNVRLLLIWICITESV